ncbi:invasion associated locus B family protein [Maritalea porphyrae]|uniref:invasion associated locus B family protein n=1 Tax=Maritalea porphyrae TaxID=880732 RepID=UPI0022AFB9D3|nr:invasion associated locus B family protein [Maritalea porphyrae]MCZ4272327.1 invasion associated locus B family protein [Maritalea porphyrae]
MRRQLIKTIISFCVLALAALPQSAVAQSVQSLGDFKAWSAYSTTRSATPFCFIHSKPISVEPELEGMEQPYFYVTHRPSEGVAHEMNLVAGFELGTDSLAVIKIGGNEFSMFTQQDSAWLEDPSLSGEMASAMRRGTTMEFEGVNKQGARVTLTFSLSGATASMRKIDSACNQ